MEQDSPNTTEIDDKLTTRLPAASNMPSRPKPSVVRCLFPETGCDKQAQNDNSRNLLKDIISADVERMRAEWNYDAENDRPLNGAVKWEKADDNRYDWVGFIANTPEKDSKENEDPSNETEEVNPQCKTKVIDKINVTCEILKKS